MRPPARGYIADDSVGKTPIDHLFYALLHK